MRFAAELMEAVEFSKSKIKELTKIVDTFIAVITDLEENYFTDPDKEAVLKTVLQEQEAYEEKHDEFLRKNDLVILEADNALTGANTVQQVVALPEENAGNPKWRNFKPQTSLKPSFLEKEATHLETVQFTRAFNNYILDGYGGNPPVNAVSIQLQPLINPL